MFRDRKDAGQKLAAALRHYRGKDVMVLALPRGGVVLGREIAEFLGAPLDVLIVRKLGVPWQPELAMGAVSETGAIILNDNVISAYNISRQRVDEVISVQKKEIERRREIYRKGRGIMPVKGRMVILVDDGIATGATMKAALTALKKEGPAKLIAAVPVSPPETQDAIKRLADDFVCLEVHPFFTAIGSFYYDFRQVTDEEVVSLLEEAAGGAGAGSRAASHGEAGSAARSDDPPAGGANKLIPADSVMLEGDLQIPHGARAVVVFAHGSGSSRHSPRNKFVAHALRSQGLGTLLFDLLTVGEDVAYEKRFDIALLTGRLIAATKWLRGDPTLAGLAIGYFGSSTGAAAALRAAAHFGGDIGAVVSRGGRPDLAGEEALRKIQSPTLLIVGEQDRIVIELNRRAFEYITAEKRLEIVPGATHLFEEPGTLEEVARLAAGWFVRYLVERALI
ncbi:MAG: phosphoribosyltransferase family protein [Nitrospiraceae bacterium]|nr:phosphoribosyltransferase family protein [Nitrospiraceae bacterium]